MVASPTTSSSGMNARLENSAFIRERCRGPARHRRYDVYVPTSFNGIDSSEAEVGIVPVQLSETTDDEDTVGGICAGPELPKGILSRRILDTPQLVSATTEYSCTDTSSERLAQRIHRIATFLYNTLWKEIVAASGDIHEIVRRNLVFPITLTSATMFGLQQLPFTEGDYSFNNAQLAHFERRRAFVDDIRQRVAGQLNTHLAKQVPDHLIHISLARSQFEDAHFDIELFLTEKNPAPHFCGPEHPTEQ